MEEKKKEKRKKQHCHSIMENFPSPRRGVQNFFPIVIPPIVLPLHPPFSFSIETVFLSRFMSLNSFVDSRKGEEWEA